MYNILQFSPIFRGIKALEIKEALDKVQHYTKNFAKGESIAFRDETYETLMIVIEGCAKGEMQDFNGKVIKIEDLEAPAPLAPAFLFGSSNKLPVDISAETDCKILYIPKKSFISLLQSNAAILQNYMDRICDKANFLSNKIWFLSFKTIKEKLSHYILSLDKNKENRIVLNKSQTELAVFFGVARPSIARVLSELETEGIIETNGKIIKILDRQALIDMIGE